MPEAVTSDSAAPRILGVDPGSLATGWGLIGGPPGSPHCLDSGLIRLGRSTEDLSKRLWRLYCDLEEVVRRCRPTIAAVEAAYHGNNARSALQLAHARGVVLTVLAGASIDVVEYTPATVKKSVTGNGRAPKDQVRSMVDRILAPAKRHAASDPWDALAVALCHASCHRYHLLTSRPRPRRRAPGPAGTP